MDDNIMKVQVKILILVLWLLLLFYLSVDASQTLTGESIFVNENIYKPVKLYVSDEYVYLLDEADQKLKIFKRNRDQTLIRSIGGKGEGPGEFKNAVDFKVMDDKIYILDAYKLELFSKETGKHLQTRRLKTASTMSLWMDREKCYMTSISVSKGSKLIHGFKNNREMEPLVSFLETSSVREEDLSGIYNNFGSLVYRDGKIYFSYMLSNKVLEYTEDGTLLRKIELPFPHSVLKDFKMEFTHRGLRMVMDKGVIVSLRNVGDEVYALAYNEKKETLIYKVTGGPVQEMYRLAEQIEEFQITGNKLWSIGYDEEDEIAVLVYTIKK